MHASVSPASLQMLALDDRENSVSASGSLLLFMEAGVFGSPRPWGGQRLASGPLGMAVAEGKPPRGFQARRAVRRYVRPGALGNVAEPPLGVARAGRDVYDPYGMGGRFGGLSALSGRLHAGPPNQPARAANGQQTSETGFAQPCGIESRKVGKAA